MILSKRIGQKVPVIYTTPELSAVSKAWKFMFNTVLRRKLFYSFLPSASHVDARSYESPDENFYSIIFKDEEDTRLLKYNIDSLKQSIKKGDQDVIEVSLTGKYFLLRLVSAYMMALSCITYLGDQSQQSLREFA